jgi:hypothetical protein
MRNWKEKFNVGHIKSTRQSDANNKGNNSTKLVDHKFNRGKLNARLSRNEKVRSTRR